MLTWDEDITPILRQPLRSSSSTSAPAVASNRPPRVNAADKHKLNSHAAANLQNPFKCHWAQGKHLSSYAKHGMRLAVSNPHSIAFWKAPVGLQALIPNEAIPLPLGERNEGLDKIENSLKYASLNTRPTVPCSGMDGAT